MSTSVILAGAGGLAVEVYEYLRQDIAAGYVPDCRVAGVLDDFAEKYYSQSGLPVPLLGSIADARIAADQRVIVAIGTPADRAKCVARLRDRGARFMTFVHSSCYVAANVRLGEGALVCPNAILNYGSQIGDFALLNVFASAGHGSRIGAYAVLSPYAALNGDASIGDRTFLGTRATVFPKVAVGNDCIVDSHSFVKGSVGDAMMVSNRSEYLVVRDRLPR